MTDDPSPPSETTSDPGSRGLDGLSTELFDEPPPPGQPLTEPPGPTLFDLADSARHRRRRWRLGAFILVFLIVVIGAILLLETGESSESPPTNASTASLQLFACPGDTDPLVVLGEGDLVLDGVDETGEWVRLVAPLAGIAEGWGRVEEIDGPLPALPVRQCDPTVEETPSDVLAEAVTPTSVPTSTPLPTPSPTVTTAAPTPTPAIGARPPAQVTVQVANGGTTAGAAGGATDELSGAGYVTQVPRNASSRAGTEILFAPGYRPDAVAIGRSLDLADPRLLPLADRDQVGFDPGRAQVVVILGPPDA